MRKEELGAADNDQQFRMNDRVRGGAVSKVGFSFQNHQTLNIYEQALVNGIALVSPSVRIPAT